MLPQSMSVVMRWEMMIVVVPARSRFSASRMGVRLIFNSSHSAVSLRTEPGS